MIRALQPTSKHFVMPIDHQMQLNKGHISHFSILRYWAKSTMIQQQMEWMVRSCNTAELSPDMNQHHLATIPFKSFCRGFSSCVGLAGGVCPSKLIGEPSDPPYQLFYNQFSEKINSSKCGASAQSGAAQTHCSTGPGRRR